MSQRDYFQVGAKLIGLYCLVLVLPVFLGILPMVIAVVGDSTKASDQFGVHVFPLFASPVLLGAFGLYLLKSQSFSDRIFHTEVVVASASNLPEYFTAGVKLYGVFLIAGTTPSLLKLLATYLFVLNQASPHAGIAAAAMGLNSNFVPDLAMIGFGILLLFKGEIMTTWAFASAEEDQPRNV